MISTDKTQSADKGGGGPQEKKRRKKGDINWGKRVALSETTLSEQGEKPQGQKKKKKKRFGGDCKREGGKLGGGGTGVTGKYRKKKVRLAGCDREKKKRSKKMGGRFNSWEKSWGKRENARLESDQG